MTTYRTTVVDGLKIFSREAGDPQNPTILLLHGFPSSSQMFRDLIPLLADRFHLVAPDYPGYGYSDAPDDFEATFDHVTAVMERFLEARGLTKFHLYMQDFGGPVGFRIATHHPEWISSLIVQNANAYDEGLAPMVRDANQQRAETPATDEEMAFELGPDLARLLYLHGARDPEGMDPDSLALADYLMDRPGHRRISAGLLNDYHTNLELYPIWQAYLRQHQPRTLVVWGVGDPVFLPPGAEAYGRDVKDAEIHLLNTSHFALEEDAPAIAEYIGVFLRE